MCFIERMVVFQGKEWKTLTDDLYYKGRKIVEVYHGNQQYYPSESYDKDGIYKVILTWGSSPSDLDSHVISWHDTGSQYHVYYGSKTASYNGVTVCNLDTDDTSAYGPETIRIYRLNQYPIYYYVYQYSSSGSLTGSSAIAKLYKYNKLIRTYNIPTSGSGLYWNVFAIKNNQIIERNTIDSSSITNYAT